MEILLWGVRGSIASPTQGTQFYGANTLCIEARTADDTLLIFDAGSGIRLLSGTLPPSGECHLFITHGHADHTQGLGFFQPFNNPDWTIHLYLPEWLEHMPEYFFDGSMFPVPYDALKATLVRHVLKDNVPVTIATPTGSVLVEHFLTTHPGGNLAYKVHADNSTFLYSGDHEITEDPACVAATEKMLTGVDLAVVDAAYNNQDYVAGWGHSSWERWVELAKKTQVGRLVLSHHAPGRADVELDALQRQLVQETRDEKSWIYVAREGMRFILPEQAHVKPECSDWKSSFLDDLAQYRDESVILDRILTKMRGLTKADAGTVFLAEGNELVFAYTHNDTFFPVDVAYKYAYVNMRLPISEESIAGYVAVTGNILNLADVRTLSKDVPYQFNSEFDDKTGYVTKSILTIPLFDRNKDLLGVLQLINSTNTRTGQVQPFTADMERVVKTLAREANKFLEFSSIVRQNIYRMLHITAIHDPRETGPHAERVGAITAELYQRWAEKRDEAPENIRFVKSQLRLAAMLHDIGKIGISDIILKKPGQLTQEEFSVIRSHATLGGELLASTSKDLTELAHDIALHHHQKWNGEGYGGADLEDKLAGEDIPLTARLTALADVFDALVSRRCYKKPWSFEDAVAFLEQEAGQHFDPDVVECFLEITDIVKMIYERYPENGNGFDSPLRPANS